MRLRQTAVVMLMLLMAGVLRGQELKVNLMVNAQSVQGTNTSVFESLERDLKEFLNSTKWTDMVYAEAERIECNFALVVRSYSADGLMQCDLQVQASRPVYGTSYTTTLINVRDQNVNFHYQEFDRLEIDGSSYDNNLTAIMAYYCYLIIGCDLDSYSRKGGTPFFQQANQIVMTCQSKSDENEVAGWRAFESKGSRNRYALISNLTDSRYEKVRDFYYEYHRLALDNMAKNVVNGRAMISEGIEDLRALNRDYPGSAIVLTFLDSKNDELINIFKKGTPDEKKKAVDSLTAMNPTQGTAYDAINDAK